MEHSSAYYDTLMRLMTQNARDQMGRGLMKFGVGWFLFRCRRCGGAFVATGNAEWCDCGNTNFGGPGDGEHDRIVIESVLTEATEGCIVVWDERLAGSLSEWVAKMKDRHRNRTAMKWPYSNRV